MQVRVDDLEVEHCLPSCHWTSFLLKHPPGFPIRNNVSRFLDNAARVFEAAESASQAGTPPSDMTIVIGEEGGISLMAGSDWPLDSLQIETGAQMVYRVRQQDGRVLVEGRAGARTCSFAAEQPKVVARRLLADPLRNCLPWSLPNLQVQ